MEFEEVLSRIEVRAGKYGDTASEVHDYFDARKRVYANLAPNLKEAGIISEANWLVRRTLGSSMELGIHVKPGDICYLENKEKAGLYITCEYSAEIVRLWLVAACVWGSLKTAS